MVEWLNSAAPTDPGLVLIAGIAAAALATLAALIWPPSARKNADPLSRLFDPDNLDSELSRVAGRPAHAYRNSPAARCGAFARGQQPGSGQRAMMAYLAQRIRADGLVQRSVNAGAMESAGEWEEVLLLPPPCPAREEQVAKAA